MATEEDKKQWSEVKVGQITKRCPKGGKTEGKVVAGHTNDS